MNKKAVVLGIGIALALPGCTVNISNSSPTLPSEDRQDFLACDAFVNDWIQGVARTVIVEANYLQFIDDVDLIIAKIDSFDTSLALRVVNLLENDIQTKKANFDVNEEYPAAKMSLGEMYKECKPTLGIGFLETD